MPYVREKKVPGKDGKVYRYYQLVEGKRVDGKVRQRVIAHLGKHRDVEAALEEARRQLEEVPAERDMKAEKEAQGWERQIRHRYGESLNRFHDGEIPTVDEVARRCGEEKEAPKTNEVEIRFWDITTYKRAEVPIPPEVDEYCRAFAFANGLTSELDNPDRYGKTINYIGFHDYQRRVREYWYWRERADKEEREYRRCLARLTERVAKLEGVVTKTLPAHRGGGGFSHHMA